MNTPSVDNLKFKDNGLIPVIAQSYKTGTVLMQAYVNKAAILMTIDKGLATYWSRSRESLWTKGETSGNTQKIIDIRYDCDQDCLLYLVEEAGPACHTNNYSCFYRSVFKGETIAPDIYEVLTKLYSKIEDRKQQNLSESYVAKLFSKGSDRIIQKVGEEATETVIALKNAKKEDIVSETADLIFHLLVSLVDRGVTVEDISGELLKRYK